MLALFAERLIAGSSSEGVRRLENNGLEEEPEARKEKCVDGRDQGGG